MQIRHLKQAVADEQREARFWHEQEPELKAEFVKELAVAIEIISRSPNAYLQVSKRHRNLRRFYEKRFHTHILYEYLPEKDMLQIVRVYKSGSLYFVSL